MILFYLKRVYEYTENKAKPSKKSTTRGIVVLNESVMVFVYMKWLFLLNVYLIN